MKKYLVFFCIAIFVVLLDQVSKAFILSNLKLHESIDVINGLFNIVHVRNSGAAFGMFADSSEAFRSIFFLGIGVLALSLIIYYIGQIKNGQTKLLVSLSLIFAGAIGNLIDRIRFGSVIDFIDIYISTFHWPAFNVADSAITVGAYLMLMEMFRRSKERGK